MGYNEMTNFASIKRIYSLVYNIIMDIRIHSEQKLLVEEFYIENWYRWHSIYNINRTSCVCDKKNTNFVSQIRVTRTV